MKKIIISLLFLFVAIGAFGQNKFAYQIQAKGGLSVGNTADTVKIDSVIKSGSVIKFYRGSEVLDFGYLPYTDANANLDMGAYDITTTGTTTTGSVTSGSVSTDVLQIGDKDSYNVLNIDSIVRVGNTFQIFDGNTQLDPDFTDAGSTDLGIWAKMQADTVPIFVFGLGSGQSGDTAVFNDNAIAGAFWHNESDTLVVTSLMGVLAEGTGTETIAVQVSWGDNFKDGTPTNLNTSAYTITSITSGDEDTAFDNAEIPPNKWVWCTISGTSAGNRPSMLVLTLSGYYKNQSW